MTITRFTDASGDELAVIPGPDTEGGPYVTVHADSPRQDIAVSVELRAADIEQLVYALHEAARAAGQQPTPNRIRLDDLTSAIHDSLASFNAVARWAALQLPQTRWYLAEHLANDLMSKPATQADEPKPSRIRLDNLTDTDLDQLYNRLDDLEGFTDVVSLELENWHPVISPKLIRHELAELTSDTPPNH
ncbi:hypothetical protein [Streptomyces sp. NPDC053079]|uniref:hypothetical protein n=1 Tax=Streptomyces sp. NPDC053079 TaxID=3365697 RepID=UPI0037CDC497